MIRVALFLSGSIQVRVALLTFCSVKWFIFNKGQVESKWLLTNTKSGLGCCFSFSCQGPRKMWTGESEDIVFLYFSVKLEARHLLSVVVMQEDIWDLTAGKVSESLDGEMSESRKDFLKLLIISKWETEWLWFCSHAVAQAIGPELWRVWFEQDQVFVKPQWEMFKFWHCH
jgi:hypothetical protein